MSITGGMVLNQRKNTHCRGGEEDNSFDAHEFFELDALLDSKANRPLLKLRN